jgi:hypothetical protein
MEDRPDLLGLCVIGRFDPTLHEANEAALGSVHRNSFNALLGHARLNQSTYKPSDHKDRNEKEYGLNSRRHRQSEKEGSYVHASMGEASGMPKTASTNEAAMSSSEYVEALSPARTTTAMPATATPRTKAQRSE